MIKILKKIKYILVFIRFVAPWRPDTFFISKIFYKISLLLNYKEFKLREQIAQKKITENIINPKSGILKIKLSSLKNYLHCKEDIDNLKNEFHKINWDNIATYHSKKFLLVKQIDCSDSKLQKLTELLIPIISKYLGTLPILQSAEFWYSPNIFNDTMRSQNWHIDGEDFKQVKIWLPIENVKKNSGPLHVIDIEETKRIFKLLNKNKIYKKRNIKIQDDQINKHLDREKLKVLTMDTDEIVFVDTCNCFHYGSRKDENPRKLLHLHFTSAFSENIPLFSRNKKINNDSEIDLVNQYYHNNFEYIKNNIRLKKFEFKIL
jgi:hypothetical protein